MDPTRGTSSVGAHYSVEINNNNNIFVNKKNKKQHFIAYRQDNLLFLSNLENINNLNYLMC